jgi:hypothetical protein
VGVLAETIDNAGPGDKAAESKLVDEEDRIPGVNSLEALEGQGSLGLRKLKMPQLPAHIRAEVTDTD